MRITEFLGRQDVTTSVPAADKARVLATLVDHMAHAHPELKRDVLLAVLLKREELGSTGIEHGVAFPHGRVPGLAHLMGCFGRCRAGVNFQSFDGKPTHFFMMLLIPEHSESVHLRALARLNRLFQDASFRGTLLDAPDADALFDVLLEQDNRC